MGRRSPRNRRGETPGAAARPRSGFASRVAASRRDGPSLIDCRVTQNSLGGPPMKHRAWLLVAALGLTGCGETTKTETTTTVGAGLTPPQGTGASGLEATPPPPPDATEIGHNTEAYNSIV